MKKFLLCAAFALVAQLHAQQNDSTLIRETVMNYIEGFYNADAKRMEKAVHPELAKRIMMSDKERFMIRNMSASELIYTTSKYKRPETDNKETFQATITIYDIYKDIATVRVITNKFKFLDYIHLVRINSEWKIINVLWAFLDEAKASK